MLTINTVFNANKYRQKNVKTPRLIAQFAIYVHNTQYVNGLSLHTKNAVIFTESLRILFYGVYNVKTKTNMTRNAFNCLQYGIKRR